MQIEYGRMSVLISDLEPGERFVYLVLDSWFEKTIHTFKPHLIKPSIRLIELINSSSEKDPKKKLFSTRVWKVNTENNYEILIYFDNFKKDRNFKIPFTEEYKRENMSFLDLKGFGFLNNQLKVSPVQDTKFFDRVSCLLQGLKESYEQKDNVLETLESNETSLRNNYNELFEKIKEDDPSLLI